MRKPFDIRKLFGEECTAERVNVEEQSIYDALDNKRGKKNRKSDAFLDKAELEVLENIDLEIASPSTNPKRARSIERPAARETRVDNREWKIRVLKNLLEKNSHNTDAAIKLAQMLDEDESRKLLLNHAIPEEPRIWKELVMCHYSPEILGDALKVKHADEDYYLALYEKAGDPRALRLGLEAHPKSRKLGRAVSESGIIGGEAFLYASAAENEELMRELLLTGPAPAEIERLYQTLEEKKIFSSQLAEHVLRARMQELRDRVLNGLYDQGLECTMDVLSRVPEQIELPKKALGHRDVRRYLRRIHVRPMTALPSHLHSLFASLSRHSLLDDILFLSIYEVVKQHLLTAEFIDGFFVMNPGKYFVDLLKAKERWKLYSRTRDMAFFRKADRTLIAGCRKHGRHRKLFILARSKMYCSIGDFHSAYLLIPRKMRTIKKYVLLSQLNRRFAIDLVRADLFDYKHHLLYAELVASSGADPTSIYEECLKRYPERAEVHRAYLRHLKMINLEKAMAYADSAIKKMSSDEWIWFERFVVYKKCRRPCMAVLYNSRKHLRSDLLEGEIKYLENRELGEENPYHGYFVYKRAAIKECNRDGVCDGCRPGLQEYYRGRIMRYQDDGDNYLLLYMINGGLDEELRSMAEFFDPAGGGYWCRLRKIQNLEEKFSAGERMLRFDMSK
jgi:hypothetical protein